jgi:amphi-Trp domain-containing protein
MATIIPARFRGRARRDAAAFYLSQISRGLLSGDLVIASGDRPTALVPAEFLTLEIDVRQGKRVNHVDVRVRWPALDRPRRDWQPRESVTHNLLGRHHLVTSDSETRLEDEEPEGSRSDERPTSPAG